MLILFVTCFCLNCFIIVTHTYDFDPGELENNPHRIINRSLVGRNYAGLQRASGLLYLVMTALRKLHQLTPNNNNNSINSYGNREAYLLCECIHL